MQFKGIKAVVRLVFCCLLLGLSITGVASSGEKPAIATAGSFADNRPFVEPSDAYCESDCCWAYCWGYDDCNVSCSSSGCSASGGDEKASVSCNET